VTGEDDLSHYLSEYFGSWRGLAYTRARSTLAWLRSEGGLLATVNEVACSGSAAAIPVPPFGLVPAEAPRNLVPAVLVSELGRDLSKVDGTSTSSSRS
jgi:hypothetical protein